jgi:hypothetical protein
MVPEEIIKACQLAEGPRSCQYVNNGQPCCVIAQLYVLRGGDVEDMYEWDDVTRNSVSNIIEDFGIDFGYDEYQLSVLQALWDNCDTTVLDDSRKLLLEKAEEVFSEE